MKIAMLWFDPGPDSLAAKIERAAAYYAKKYGQAPNLVVVHPTEAPTNGDRAAIEVQTKPYVRPNHYLIGRSDPA